MLTRWTTLMTGRPKPVLAQDQRQNANFKLIKVKISPTTVWKMTWKKTEATTKG